MRLYLFVFLAFVAVSSGAETEKGKRRAQSSTQKASFVTTTSAPSYITSSEENYVTASTSAPAYATKLSSNPKIRYVAQPDQPESSYQQQITIQPKLKLSYGTQPIRQPAAQQVYLAQPQYPQQQFAYSFEAAQLPEQVKYTAVAAQPQFKYITVPQAQYLTAAPQQLENVKYVAQKQEPQQPQIQYQYQPQAPPQFHFDQVKYLAQAQQQPQQYEQIKYINLPQSQPAPQTVKYVYAPQPQAQPQPQQEIKYAYSQPAPVTKSIAAAPAKVAYQAPARPHYSPADTVSHFRFSSPHVTYSNLGVLSQIIGKGYNPPQAAAAAQTNQPQYQQQYSAPPQYITAATAQQPQQVAYGPTGHFQIPQVQYVQSGPQHAQSGKQYVYALPQNLGPKRSYLSPGITYA